MPADEERQLFHRGENFESLYANNVQFQPFEWDLRLIFGELDVPVEGDNAGKLVIDQHTAITIPWLQAKLSLYFLSLQIGVHEMSHGHKIRIPEALIPPEPIAPSGDMESNPIAHKVYEFIKSERERFLATAELE